MKTMGYVNMFNRGIGQVQTDLKENGNPPAEFDVNLITAFRVDVKIVEKTMGMKEKVATSSQKVATSSQKVATSNEKVASSGGMVATSNSKVATMKKKISAEEMAIYILEFCNTWRSMDEIAQFADRDKNYIRNKVLPRLADKLEKEHPDSPNHPRQKYRAKKKE